MRKTRWSEKLTPMNDPMNIIQVSQPFQHTQRDLPYDIDINRSNLLVNAVQRSPIHILHANANVGIRDERAVEGNDIWRMAVVHYLEFSQDLFPYRRLGVDQHDLCGVRELMPDGRKRRRRGRL